MVLSDTMRARISALCLLAVLFGLVGCQEVPQTPREGSPFDRFEGLAAAEAPRSIQTSIAAEQSVQSLRRPGSETRNEIVLGGQGQWELCDDRPRHTCVVDGDTFWLDGVKVRIADIDTPEVSRPQCEQELALGRQATNRLMELMNAGPFELHTSGTRDEDRFGRKLRVVVRNGTSLGDQLVAEGLARKWTGRREPWC